MAHLSQKRAVKFLKTETGLSWDWARKQVQQLPKVPDGKRLKVRTADLRRIVLEANIAPIVQITMRPFSKKQIDRVQKYGLPSKRKYV
jgi:hypothetical protein